MGQVGPALSSGNSAESAWLLKAPPWRESPGQDAEERDPRKREFSEISMAERTIGKLALQTAAAMQREGWQAYVARVRGASNHQGTHICGINLISR